MALAPQGALSFAVITWGLMRKKGDCMDGLLMLGLWVGIVYFLQHLINKK